MTSQFTVRFLQLTDDDLRGLGAIAAHWALAEHFANDLLSTLHGCPEASSLQVPPEEAISFERKTRTLKKLLRLTCAQFPRHMETGLALVTAGKELANERKIIAHWVASRSGGLNAPSIQFAKIQVPPAPVLVEHSHWTTQDLFDLADHIADWWTDLNRFRFALIVDGPLASRTTWHGPKPQDPTLDPDSFRTIGKSRWTSTRGKRQRQR